MEELQLHDLKNIEATGIVGFTVVCNTWLLASRRSEAEGNSYRYASYGVTN